MASIEDSNDAGHLSSAIRQLTKTQTKRVLLGLIQDTYDSPDDLKQIVEPFIFDRLSHHIQLAIEEARLSPVPDSVMEQELEAVDSLLESYAKFADMKLLSDVTVKMNDLFVILQSRAKDQKWQAEVQQRVNKLNTIRGKDFPDPSIFNTGYQKRGWMDKRSRSFKGWKRRWFVLKGTHLTYFAKTEPSSAATSSAEWGDVRYEGMLRKKKQGKGWKTRWAQIRPEGLLYFKSQKDKEPMGALPFSECERSENAADKSFEVTYNGVKYYFTVEHDEEFNAWSQAFAGVCPDHHDPNMAYFTIRGVIDLSAAILDDKNNDKPHCFTLTAEGGKTYVFAVDSERQKLEWLNLIGAVVKTDNSSSRRSRSTTGNGSGSGILKQMSFDKGTPAPDSPNVVRFSFKKDEVIGRPLSVRSESENFDEKFKAMPPESTDDDDEDKEEGEEAARERTKMVRRETIKLIRTFKLEVHLEDQRDIYTFAFDNSVLVDQVKSYLFKHIPALAGCNQADYSLGVDADELLTVEFLRFVSSNTFIEVAVRTCGIARVGLFLRDNLKKITEQRAARGRPLKSTHELIAQADKERLELEHKLQIERMERERLEQELKEKAATEKRLLAEKLARERELARKESERSVQTEVRTYATSATQTEEVEKPEREGEKISWRSQTSQVVLPSSIAKKADLLNKATVPTGSGNASTGNADGKPNTMITKTKPRTPAAGGWQQVQPSLSATKRPMIIPCDGWSIEVPGEALPAPAVKSWQFAIAMDSSLSETPEPFFYRKYFITAKKTTNFLGSDPKYGSISFSMCTNADGIRGVLFTKLGTRQISVSPTAIKLLPSIKSRKQQMLQFLLGKLESSINPKNLRIALHPDMQKELLSLEERQVCSGFKFGVVYAKGGQSEENELFNNEHGSEEWNEFLDLLGTRIQLKGWTQYNAGLDVKGNTTGTHSLYTNWKGNEIMFHVSTMLPFHPEDPQKLERKRHVGNDICVIIYQEGATPYLPSTITSHFNHIIAVVHYDKAVGGYRLGFAFKDGVPAFGPVLNSHGFVKKSDLKELLLTKLINGEAASLLAPVFAQKLVRTREALLNYYLQQFL